MIYRLWERKNQHFLIENENNPWILWPLHLFFWSQTGSLLPSSEALKPIQMCLWLLPVWPCLDSPWGPQWRKHVLLPASLDFDSYWELTDRCPPISILSVPLAARQGNDFTGFCSDKELLVFVGLQLCFSSSVGHYVQRFLQSYHEMWTVQLMLFFIVVYRESNNRTESTCWNHS